MRDVSSLAAGCGYVLTDLGRAYTSEETCRCERIVLTAGRVECEECGTVIGLTRDIRSGAPALFAGRPFGRGTNG